MKSMFVGATARQRRVAGYDFFRQRAVHRVADGRNNLAVMNYSERPPVVAQQ